MGGVHNDELGCACDVVVGLTGRCEEFASEELERVILDGFPSLPHRLAGNRRCFHFTFDRF